ncbi:hypothetical protein Sgly_2516 [Syntrophobotulus glycolicus DSM 8271]|uniref:Uncharacterized protein n=1 Tax=Syntrophobotulus glycolicus (strain DSM 8271 / FlGlyR) TaxID=645991 RepID=F0SW16_SYNGF|nr:hypothetical protein [Syntrophobotulus glycolicus]ADY56800.1 hypothetical protein Sgly_2516 [Syntrophobotulus glycolicus DSM 8271]
MGLGRKISRSPRVLTILLLFTTLVFVTGFTAVNAAFHNAKYTKNQTAENTTADQPITSTDVSQYQQKVQTPSVTTTTNKTVDKSVTIASPANNAVVEKGTVTIKLNTPASGALSVYDTTDSGKTLIASNSLNNAQVYSLSGSLLTEAHEYKIEFTKKDGTASQTVQSAFTVNSLKAVPLTITSPANSAVISMAAINNQNAAIKVTGPQAEVRLECVLSNESGTVIGRYVTYDRTILLKNFSGIKPGKYVVAITGTIQLQGSAYPESDKKYLNLVITDEEKTDSEKTDPEKTDQNGKDNTSTTENTTKL